MSNVFRFHGSNKPKTQIVIMSFNKVILIGNLTRDPELRFTPKGSAVCQLGIAVNRKWTTEGGEKKEEVTFVDVEAWNKAAETIAQYLKKGSAIFIEGRLKQEQWDDKQTGQKRSRMKVLCEQFQFIGGKKEGEPVKKEVKAEGVGEPVESGGNEGDDVPF